MTSAKLGDIATYINGYAFKPKDRGTEGLPIIRIQDLTGNSYDLGFYNGEYPEKVEINNGDILISWSASLGVYVWNRGKALLNQHIFKVVFDKLDINKQYFVFAVRYNLKEMEKQTHGATMKHITKKDFDNILIPFPDLRIQSKIAEKLDKLQSIITHRRTQLEKLDLLVKARFVEMFGEVGTDKFGWGLQRIGDICEVNPKKAKDVRLQDGLPVSFVPMPAVSENGEIDATEIKPYDEVKKGFTYFAENDVLFAKITPCMENGKGCVAKGLCNKIGFGSTEFHVLRPTLKTNPYWIYTVTAFKQFRKDAAANMTGSAGQRRVPAKFLENFKVALPPLDLQTQFADFVKQVDKSRVAIQNDLEQAQMLFDSLMQEYFG